jgi:hypothetical protein
VGLLTVLTLISVGTWAQTNPGDTLLKLNADPAFPWEAKRSSSPSSSITPPTYRTKVEYDGRNNQYIIYQKAGGLDYRRPVYMSPDEYRRYEFQPGHA